MTDDITTEVTRRADQPARATVEADVCVLGAGISGVSAALTAAAAGNDVVIVDAQSSIGGQAIGSMIRSIIGLYTHEPDPKRIIHGMVDDVIADLAPRDAIERQWADEQQTYVLGVDQVELGRWTERAIDEAGITAIVGSVLTDVEVSDGRVEHVDLAHRAGPGRRDGVRRRLR